MFHFLRYIYMVKIVKKEVQMHFLFKIQEFTKEK